jgi:hypothetical protein
MSPEYLRELADLADPDELWRLNWEVQKNLPPQKCRQLDMGVALRRYAHYIDELQRLLGTGRSMLVTPLSANGTDVRSKRTPKRLRKLMEKRG